ncbi:MULTISPECIES: hypothetical protein [unclassified Brucella]|uniref:hypothetical protein n=1 Tax=unclassified Brucella TaxID=2632610 RepID=UPI00217D77B7|nr:MULTISPECIES: hypothetical protein [unclassified Brucella]UWF67335.1 hypothetical protein NYO63_04125 [Brucella sp. 1315]UWF70460.1 hypothetical protein NYO65_04125 [Brucella sp. 2594]
MSQKDAVLAMRNAMFAVGDGMSLDAFMQGSIMAQAKMATETANTPEQAAEILTHYFNIAIDAIPHYWSERSGRAALRERE